MVAEDLDRRQHRHRQQAPGTPHTQPNNSSQAKMTGAFRFKRPPRIPGVMKFPSSVVQHRYKTGGRNTRAPSK